MAGILFRGRRRAARAGLAVMILVQFAGKVSAGMPDMANGVHPESPVPEFEKARQVSREELKRDGERRRQKLHARHERKLQRRALTERHTDVVPQALSGADVPARPDAEGGEITRLG